MKRIIKLAITFLMLASCTCFTAFAKEATMLADASTIYVSASGNDENDGLSAASPVATLTKAYELLGETGNTVYIIGTYKGTENLGIAGRKLYIKGTDSTARLQRGSVTLAGEVELEKIIIHISSAPSGLTPNFVTNGNSLTIGKGVTTANTWGMALQLANYRWSNGTANINLNFATDSYLVFNNMLLCVDADYSGYTGTFNFNFGGTTSAANVYLGRGHSANYGIKGIVNYNLSGKSSVTKLTMGSAGNAGQVSFSGLKYITLSDSAKIGTLYMTAEAAASGFTRSGVAVLEINGGTITNDIAINADDATKRVVIMNNGLFTKADSSALAVNDDKAVVLKVEKGGYAKAVTTTPTAENSYACELLGFTVTAPEDDAVILIDGVEASSDENGVYSITSAGVHNITFKRNIKSYTVTIDGATAEYEEGTRITLPTAPAKDDAQHYTFKWTDGESTFDAGSEYTVTKNVTLSAQWTVKKYTVTILDNSVTEDYNTVITLPATVDNASEDYIYKWYDETNGTEYDLGSSYTVKGNATITLKQATKVYTVYVDATNGVDTNDGATAETAVKTLTKAYEILGNHGDTVILIGQYSNPEKLGIAGRTLYIKGSDSTAKLYGATFELAGNVELEKVIIHISSTPSGLTPNFITYSNSIKFGNEVTISGGWGLPLQLANHRFSNAAANITMDFTSKSYLIFNNILLCVDANYSGFTGTLDFNFGGNTGAGNVYIGRGDSTNAGVRGIINYNLTGSSSITKLTMGSGNNGGQVSFAGLKYITLSEDAKIGTLYMTAEKAASGFTRSGVAVLEINGGRIVNDIEINDDDETKRVVIMNNGLFTKTDASELAVNDSKAIVLKVAKGGYAKAITTTPEASNSYACELLGFTITAPAENDVIIIDGKLATPNNDGVYTVEDAGVHSVEFKELYTVNVNGASEEYVEGTKITLPEAPAKENAQHYTFKWSDGKNTYDAKAQYTVIGNVTFTAVWTPVSYTVIFKNGNEIVSEETAEYGSTITAPETELVKEGHYFDGWYSDGVKFADGATVAGNVTYIAEFKPNSYNIEISVVPTVGGNAEGSGKYEYGSVVTLKATANKGYTFDGWYDGDSKVSDSESFDVTVYGAKSYTAKFVKAKIEIVGSLSVAREEGSKPYNVTYDDGTTYSSAARIVVYSGEEIVLDTTEDENAQFSFRGELGTYRVVIIKNGYLTYDNEIQLVIGDELSHIALIPGDIKSNFDDECGDGVIDIDDFIRVLRGFAANSSANVRDAVDINEDGVVNVADLALIKANFNKTPENYR